MADKPLQSADDNVVMNRFDMKFEKTIQTGGAGRIRKTVDRVRVIYAVDKVTGVVTVYENKRSLLGVGPDEDLRNLKPTDLTTIAVWSPDSNNPQKGSWEATDPTKRYGEGGTWDDLSKLRALNGSTATDNQVTNIKALNAQVANDVSETGLLTTEQREKVKFPGNNTATVDPTARVDDDDGGGNVNPTVGLTSETRQEPLNVDVSGIVQTKSYGVWGKPRNYTYPLTLPEEVSDIIQFQIVDYRTQSQRGLGVSGQLSAFSNITDLGRSATKSLQADTQGTINLAIQPPLSDSNGVNWTDSGINLVQLAAAGLSAGFIEGAFSGMFQSYSDIENIISTDKSEIKSALKLYFASQAAQTSGLQSRLTGSVLNPNLETLFEGPRTRTFTYRFQFTPRGDKEAVEVRSIIRAFKEAMAVKRSAGNAFLKAPFVFNISYLYKTGVYRDGNVSRSRENPYIGKVKGPCALKDMSVDYTPQGTYMSFDSAGSGDGSMVAYNVTLAFQELDPIYFDDYNFAASNEGMDAENRAGVIGY